MNKLIALFIICLVFSKCTVDDTPEGHISFGKNHLYKLADDEKEMVKNKEQVEKLKPFLNTNTNVQLPLNKIIQNKDSSLTTFITLVHPANHRKLDEVHKNDSTFTESGALSKSYTYAQFTENNYTLLRVVFECKNDENLYTINYLSKDANRIKKLKENPKDIIKCIKCDNKEE